MNTLNIFIIISALITVFLTLIGLIAPINSEDSNKVSPYECGFDPINSPRLPFSFRFFLIAILFLIFDLEIALLLPLPFSVLLTNPIYISTPLTIFILILTLGLYYEWIKGGLEWADNN